MSRLGLSSYPRDRASGNVGTSTSWQSKGRWSRTRIAFGSFIFGDKIFDVISPDRSIPIPETVPAFSLNTRQDSVVSKALKDRLNGQDCHETKFSSLSLSEQRFSNNAKSEIPFNQAYSAAEPASGHRGYDEMRVAAGVLVDDRIDFGSRGNEDGLTREGNRGITHDENRPEDERLIIKHVIKVRAQRN